MNHGSDESWWKSGHVFVLLGLLGLLLVIGWISSPSDNDEQQLQVAPMAPATVDAGDKQNNSQSMLAASSLRLSTARPSLDQPGLQYDEKQEAATVDRVAQVPSLVLPTTNTEGKAAAAMPGRVQRLKGETSKAVPATPKPAAVNAKPIKTKPAAQPAKPTPNKPKPAKPKPAKPAPVKPKPTKAVPAEDSKAATAPVAKQQPSSQSKPTNATLFSALPDDAWLLQVATVITRADADKQCAALALPCTSYAAQRYGRQVWILVAGPFANHATAMEKVKALPKKIRDKGPFARRVKAVKKEATQ